MIFYNLKKFLSLLIGFTLLTSSCDATDETSPDIDYGMEHHDIVIVGAGISGLTCGHFLGNRDFVILEKNNKVGGRAVSGLKNNFTYAKGAEYLGKPEYALAKMIKQLNLTPREIPFPMDAYFDGNQFYYGTEGLERYLITGSSVSEYKRFIRLLLNSYDKYEDVPDLVYSSWARNLDYTNAETWLKNNAIPDIYIRKYNVSSRGLFGASLSEISALSFIPEAAFDYDESDLSGISADFDINNEYANALKEKSESYSFTKGLTELTDRLGEIMNSRIRLNSTVSEVRKEGDKYIVSYSNKEGEQQTILANNVVLAIPLPLALRIAPELITDEKKTIIEQVEYSSYATVALFSKTPVFDKAFDLAVPDNYFFTDIYDATWIERFYDKNKKPDTYIISVYIAPQSYTDHSLDRMTDSELLQKVYTDLDKVFPGASEKITGYDIEHFPYAYPVMTPGAYERLLRLDKLNNGSFILAGDGIIYPTFESAVESGYLAADKLK